MCIVMQEVFVSQYDHDGFIDYDKSGMPVGPSGAPFQDAEGGADHWIYEGTGLKAGDVFGRASLHERVGGGASAHELDKIGPLSPPNTVLLAKGLNKGGAGAEVAYHERVGGGAVFAASSLCWVMALPIDSQLSAITSNVLNCFLASS